MGDSLEFVKTLIKPENVSEEPGASEKMDQILRDMMSKKITTEEAILMCENESLLKDTSIINQISEMMKCVVIPLEQTLEKTIIPVGSRKKSRPWTAEEDQRLTQAVNTHGPNNWGAVCSMVGGDRTRAQCSQRWNRVINPNISKANWSSEEEMKLLEAVKQFGTKAWTRVAAEMGNRCDVQCRFKYNFLMKKKQDESQLSGYINPENAFLPPPVEQEDKESLITASEK